MKKQDWKRLQRKKLGSACCPDIYLGMLLSKPVKRWALGFRVSSNLNRSFNWIELASSQTFDTQDEVISYMEATPNWNRHRNLNQPSVGLPCGPFELTDEEMAFYERQPKR